MKRFHVHLSVPDLPASVRFYSSLFGMPPSVERHDYAKWMLEDPRVNFAISHRSGRTGLNHLGLQVDEGDELPAVRERFAAADAASTLDEPDARCCYAVSDKHWVQDPQGIPWEGFHTLGTIPLFDADAPASACGTDVASGCGTAGAGATASGCCAPSTAAEGIEAPATATAGCCAPTPATQAPPGARARCCA